jgi:bla regulator protein BlaR1
MDFSHFVFDEKYLSAIGWTLAHSIWQIALVSVALWAVLKAMSKVNSQLRYLTGLGALFLILLITCWTFVSQLSSMSTSEPERVLASVQQSPVSPELHFVSKEGARLFGQPTAVAYWVGTMESLLPYLVHLWMLGAIFYSGRLAGSVYDLQKLHKKHHESVSQKLLKRVDGLSSAMGLYQKVQVLRSTLVRTPVTYGFIKPVILIPAALVFSISPAQLEAVIAHELAHIKRNDYLAHLFQSSMEVLFFYHPCFWWINQFVNEERENATDDLALASGISSHDLAHGLAEVANYSHTPAPDMALAASASKYETLSRIKRILGKKSKEPKLSPIIPITMILALITASAIMVAAENQDLKTADPILLTEISHDIVSYNRPFDTTSDSGNEVAMQDTLPAKKLPRKPDQEGMPVLNLTPPPQLEVEMPAMPEPPPVPPVPSGDFDFPQLDIHIETDSLADLAMELHKLEGDESPEAQKRRKVLQAAMEKIQTKINTLAKGFEDKMVDWHAAHGDSFKKYEDEMKVWEEKMKEHQKAWESTFAPKMEEFEKKMKLWEEENAPKLKEFEEKMKQWVEENEEKFQWQEETGSLSH